MALYLGHSTGYFNSQFAWLRIHLIPGIVVDLQRFDIGLELDFEPVGFGVK